VPPALRSAARPATPLLRPPRFAPDPAGRASARFCSPTVSLSAGQRTFPRHPPATDPSARHTTPSSYCSTRGFRRLAPSARRHRPLCGAISEPGPAGRADARSARAPARRRLRPHGHEYCRPTRSSFSLLLNSAFPASSLVSVTFRASRPKTLKPSRAAVRAAGGEVEDTSSSSRGAWSAHPCPRRLPALAARGDVQWIEERPPVSTLNDQPPARHTSTSKAWQVLDLTGRGQLIGTPTPA
jgi:hypothetical protein